MLECRFRATAANNPPHCVSKLMLGMHPFGDVARKRSEGTMPAGSTWQMLPIPMAHDYFPTRPGPPFPPPCYEPHLPIAAHGQGICSGDWLTNITLYDQLRIPEHLDPGDYVLGFRWD